MAGRMRVPRTRGVLSGLLLILLGAWGALIPFVGPYFHYAYTPDNTWTYNTDRLWLEILPGAAVFLGGLIVLGSAHRALASFGGWLAALGGAWFVVGLPLSALSGMPDPGVPTGGNTRQVLEMLGFFFALGVVIVFLAALALGRFAVVGVRETRAAEEQAAAERLATVDEDRYEPGATTDSRPSAAADRDYYADSRTTTVDREPATSDPGHTEPVVGTPPAGEPTRGGMPAAAAPSEGEGGMPADQSTSGSMPAGQSTRGGMPADQSTRGSMPADQSTRGGMPAAAGRTAPAADSGADWSPPAEHRARQEDPYNGWTPSDADKARDGQQDWGRSAGSTPPVANTPPAANTPSAGSTPPAGSAPSAGNTSAAGTPAAGSTPTAEPRYGEPATQPTHADSTEHEPGWSGDAADGLPAAPPVKEPQEREEGKLHRLLHRQEH